MPQRYLSSRATWTWRGEMSSRSYLDVLPVFTVHGTEKWPKYDDRRETRYNIAPGLIDKFAEIAVARRRTVLWDQTNVYVLVCGRAWQMQKGTPARWTKGVLPVFSSYLDVAP